MSDSSATQEGPTYPEITVQLTGMDGNAFSIIGATCRALRRGGVSNQDVEAYQTEATSGDYDHLIQATARTVAVL